MFKITNFFYTRVCLFFLIAACLGGCTKKFDSMNSNPSTIASVTSSQFPQMFAYALQTPTLSPDNFEIGEGTIASVYSQFFGQAAQSFASRSSAMALALLRPIP